MTRAGGQVPDSYGLSTTVYCPTASETSKVKANDVLTLATTGPNHVAPATDGGSIDAIAKHDVSDPFEPLGVWLLRYSRVHKFYYTGTAPVIGNEIVADGNGTVRVAGDTETGFGFVMYVDTARNYVEVAV